MTPTDMTPMSEPGDQAASRAGRLRDWIRKHQRAAGIGVVVGAIALLGVAVVIGWGTFAPRLETGQTGPTPTPSVASSSEPTPEVLPSSEPTQSAAPSASASPEPGLPWPPVGEPGYRVAGILWVVSAVDDLNVRSGPGEEYDVIGQLDAGDVALVPSGVLIDWVEIVADGVIGFANIGPDDDPYLLSTPTPWKAYFTSLSGVASNGSTYVAYGMSAESDYVPHEGGVGPLLLVSDDGVTWERPSGGPGPGAVTAVAGGPAGFVALATGSMTPGSVAFSPDGRTWETTMGPTGTSVAYGPAGWLMAAWGGGLMRSADGRSWEDAGSLIEIWPGDDLTIESSDAGYVVFQRHCCTSPWATVDGKNWTGINLPIGVDDWVSDAELIGDRLLILTGDADSGETLLHRGRLAASGAVTWDGPPAPVDGSDDRVAAVAQSPDGLLATGWDTGTLKPVVWRSTDGAVWDRLDADADTLGGTIGLEPAWGSAGWVGVGATPDGSGQQVWRSSEGSSWDPAGDPVAYEGPMPPCPPADEVSVITLMYLSPFGEHCIGEESVTIRGWVPGISFLGDGASGTPDPWLARSWWKWISPGAAGEATTDYSFRTALSIHAPPEFDQGSLRIGEWVEVAGHFRDAASATCRIIPPMAHSRDGRLPSDPGAFLPHLLESPASVAYRCAQRFVVESITSVEGP